MKYSAIRYVPRYLLTTILALSLVACGGGGGGSATPAQSGGNPGVQANVSIAITSPAVGDTMETPDTSVILEGTAESPSGIASVAWSSDRGSQGEASGTDLWRTGAIQLEPGENKITITARDNAGRTATRTVVIEREALGTGSVELSWTAPTTREDGTALTDLAGYYIRYGQVSEIYDYEIKIENPGLTTYVVEGLSPGTWYFVLSAYDSEGVESNHSNEVERLVE